MSDHLPECDNMWDWVGGRCTCAAFRAYGQRVRDENVERWRAELRQSNAYEYERGVQAALDAVADVYDTLNYEHAFKPETCECVWCEDGALLLAAIDGVKP